MAVSLSCRDFVDFLDDYLAGTLGSERLATFNQHLAVCSACVVYMKTYQEATRLGKAVLPPSADNVPADIPEDLVRAILAARDRS